MNDEQIWSAIAGYRRGILDLLTGVDRAEWATPSLCEGWTVRDVAAHLTMTLLSLRNLARLFLRYRGNTNLLIREGSISIGRRHTDDELLVRLRTVVNQRRTMPGLTNRELLLDVMAHSQDIALPLGRAIELDPEHAAVAADRVLSYGGRGNAKVFKALPLEGLRLAATDHPWSWGEGLTVSGNMAYLFLLLVGRTARLAGLSGPGAPELRQRLTTGVAGPSSSRR